MSDNLDDFLRQAAERRAKRQQQKSANSGQGSAGQGSAGQGASGPIQRNTSAPQAPTPRQVPSQKPTTPSTSSQSTPSRPRQSVPSPNARTNKGPVVADVVKETRAPVGNLRTTLEQRHVESDLEYADERMEGHLEEAFSSDLQRSGKSNLRPSSAPAPTAASITPTQRSLTSGDLKDQLRNPQTLRLAILAQEILKRPYQ